MADDDSEPLVDPEDRYDDDDSDMFSSWEDTEESSEEEVTGQPSSGDKKKVEQKKKKELGKWKAELLAVTQESTSEERLHFVPWVDVCKHFFINAGTFALFVSFAIIVHRPAIIALVLFMVTFLLLVIVMEYLKQCSVQLQVSLLTLATIGIAAGVLVMGPFGFGCIVAQWAFVPLGLLVIILRAIEKPWARTVNSTSVWQAISGQKMVTLTTRLDLVKLFKGIFHAPAHSPTVFVRLRNCCFHLMMKTGMFSHNTGIRVRMVQVDESNPETMDVTLELNDGEEVEPDKYTVMRMMRPTPESGERDELAIGDLGGLLKQRKFVSDQILDSWLTTKDSTGPTVTTEGGQEGGQGKTNPKETRAQKIGKWVSKAEFPPDGNSIIVTYLRRVDYWEGLWEHWAPRAVANIMLISIFAFPAVHLLMSMDAARRELCEAGDVVKLGGVEVCGGETGFDCAEPCGSLLKWVDRMNDTIYTSYVELCLTFVMLPVFIFIFSVASAQKLHNKEELIYFRRLRQPKKAITEVLRLKQTLEEVFQPSTLMHRFLTATRAWLGADPALTACGPISDAEFDLTATRGFNDCLKQVMEPISEMKSAISCERSEMLLYGIGCDQDDNQGKEEIEKGWRMLKFNNGLADGSGRNFKVLFDLHMHREDSWKTFKEWCKTEYKDQFKEITETLNDQVQDSGTKSHLKKNTPIFDIMLPKGFSLTHVYVQSMPEDGLPLQIELTGSKSGAKEFWGLCDNLEHNIVKAVVDDEEVDSDMEDESVLDRRLQNFPIVARFALSEQYYNNMSAADVKDLCGEGDQPGDFTAFVDRLLVPHPFQIPTEPDDKNLLFYTGISVFMGDEVPFRAMLAAARGCLKVVSVYLQCILLAMFVPVFRKIMGGELFPAPFTPWLMLNALSIWYQLVSFFSEFHFGQFRLSLISQCLGLLESKTLAPTSALVQSDNKDDSESKSEDGDDEGGGGASSSARNESQGGTTEEQQAASARAAKKAKEDSRPFDLVVEDKVVGKEYDPADENWVKQWRMKHDNVANWHATVSYLRVFVSTSRLVSQAMLVAAAIVVGVLLLVSLAQALGSTGKDHAEVGADLAKAASDGQGAARRLHEDLSFALASMAENHMVGTGEPKPLAAAARHLREVLAPTRASLHATLAEQEAVLARRHSPTAAMEAVMRRLAEKSESADSGDSSLLAKAAKLDITKATKTQVFTIVMVIFVLLYSVPLMWNIVKVNEFFDRHEDILLKQKELHRINQSKREVKRGHTAGGVAAKSEAESVTQKTSNPDKDDSGDAAKGAPQLDPEGKRYERLLDMSIEASKKSRERFPLKLFGFVITAQLLATWVFLATSPIVSQLKQMAPTLAMQGCTYLESSKVVDTLQRQMDITNPSMHIHIKDMVHNNICIPLGKALAAKLGNLPDKLGDKIKGKLGKKPVAAAPTPAPAKPTARRLEAVSEAREVTDALRRWSDAHRDRPLETRFAMAQAALSELRRDADRLLVAAPRATVEGWALGGEAGFWAAMGTVRPHLELALSDLEHEEGHTSSSHRRDVSEL